MSNGAPPPPPPPPPPGFEGIYPPRSHPSTASQQLWSLARSAASTIKTKAKEIDGKYDISSQTSQKLDQLGEKTGAALSSLRAGAARHAHEARDTVVRKVQASTPEERQQWAAGAVSVLSIASLVGGPKTRIVAGATATAIAKRSCASASDLSSAVSAAGSGHDCATSSAATSPQFASSGLCEVLTLEIVATEAAGGMMLVHVEGVGDYEIIVPEGVLRGQSFPFEIEAPVGTSEAAEVVPVGQPPALLDDPLHAQCGGAPPLLLGPSAAAPPSSAAQQPPRPPASSLPQSLVADDVPTGVPVGPPHAGLPAGQQPAWPASAPGIQHARSAVTHHMQPPPPPHPHPPPPTATAGDVTHLVTAACGLAQASRELGLTPQQALQGARAAQGVAKDLGVTPQQALQAGVQGVRAAQGVAKELGVTPQQALSAGLNAIKFVAAAKGGIPGNGPR